MQPRLVSVSGRPSVAAASAAAASLSRCTRRQATASASDARVTSGPSHGSVATVSPGAPNTDATIRAASSPSKVDAAPHPGITCASSGSVSRFAAQAANKPPGRSTRRASRIGATGSA